MIEIEKNVPFPLFLRKTNKKYPFAEMKVGDSFVIPPRPKTHILQGYAKTFGIKIAIRRQPNGSYRVWRIE